VYSRLQVKNQILVLKNMQSFWQYLQVYTGLGRKKDGTIDAESAWWKTHTKVFDGFVTSHSKCFCQCFLLQRVQIVKGA
jgi:hypothetical protein